MASLRSWAARRSGGGASLDAPGSRLFGIGDEFRSKLAGMLQELVDARRCRLWIVKLPMAQSVQGALPAGVVRNGEKSPQNGKHRGVELRSVRVLGFAVEGNDVPPHVADGIEWVCRLLVQVGQMRRASIRHDLLEERHE